MTMMKIALVGYGKMGRALEQVATARGIEVVARLTRDRPLCVDDPVCRALGDAVLIDFSVPEAVPDNVRAAAALSLNLVIGTTGWGHRLDDLREVVARSRSGIGVVHASNFSVGVNVFYQLAEQAAKLLAKVDGYDPFIFDWHHRFKKDSPSGTAIEVQRRMAPYYDGRRVPITSQRAGYIPSMHAVGFDSEADTIHLEHRTRSRRGLAEGAILAARWITGHQGFHEFREVLDGLLQPDALECMPID
jgi:4-hydroxy-tetrahydrodipicolinate reductase